MLRRIDLGEECPEGGEVRAFVFNQGLYQST